MRIIQIYRDRSFIIKTQVLDTFCIASSPRHELETALFLYNTNLCLSTPCNAICSTRICIVVTMWCHFSIPNCRILQLACSIEMHPNFSTTCILTGIFLYSFEAGVLCIFILFRIYLFICGIIHYVCACCIC